MGDSPIINIDLYGVENRLDTVNTTLESIGTELHDYLHRPALDTPFEEYTVSEALLLLILLTLVVRSCINMIKGGFSWL